MYRFLETIRFEHGRAELLPLHEARLNRTRAAHYPKPEYISLHKLHPPDNNIWKCRILYSERIEVVEFHHYAVKKVTSLKTVIADEIEYSYKSEEREIFERLLALKETCDDIMIVRQGFITDASYANLLFFDGSRWYTPRTPLLAGVRREYLLATGQISELLLRLEDLRNFSQVMLINAMLPFDLSRSFPVSNIML